MNADVAFRENGDARDASAIGESVQMNMQQGCPCGLHCTDQRLFDPVTVVETLGVP